MGHSVEQLAPPHLELVVRLLLSQQNLNLALDSVIALDIVVVIVRLSGIGKAVLVRKESFLCALTGSYPVWLGEWDGELTGLS